jgi:hypothetical protein
MRYMSICLLISACVLNVGAQDIVSLYSDKDAVVGYHYMLNSENTNYNYADWFGALSQPGAMGGENHSRSWIYMGSVRSALEQPHLLGTWVPIPAGLNRSPSLGMKPR